MMTQPRWLLHAEGAVVLLASLVLYQRHGYSWWLFLALFLVPDISMLGYLRNTSLGAGLYNFVHTEILPVLLGLAALVYRPSVLPFSLIWLAHIGFDRVLGYGLKYPTRFTDTHLARV